MRIGAARKRVWPVMVAAGVVAFASSASPARAAPDCPGGLPKKNILLQGQSTLESIVFDRRGRLFFTNSDSLLRLDRRGSAPRVVTAIPGRGGLELAANGQLLVGANNDNTSAVFWGRPETGGTGASAEIWRVDPDTGAHSLLVHGLPMANGIARSADGAVYASDDFSSAGIGRVFHRHLDCFWATVNSANGLVIDPTGRYLFAAQTFQPAAVARVELAHPDHVETYWSASGSDIFGGPDGITRDERGRLYVAANGLGQVWRVDGPGRMCVLARGLMNTSSLYFGSDANGFSARNLYVVGFDGRLIELVDARPAPPAVPSARLPKLRLSIHPRRTSAGERTRFRFRVTTGRGAARRAVGHATVRFRGSNARTDSGGRAVIVTTLPRRGRYLVVASNRGYRRARARVRASG